MKELEKEGLRKEIRRKETAEGEKREERERGKCNVEGKEKSGK